MALQEQIAARRRELRKPLTKQQVAGGKIRVANETANRAARAPIGSSSSLTGFGREVQKQANSDRHQRNRQRRVQRLLDRGARKGSVKSAVAAFEFGRARRAEGTEADGIVSADQATTFAGAKVQQDRDAAAELRRGPQSMTGPPQVGNPQSVVGTPQVATPVAPGAQNIAPADATSASADATNSNAIIARGQADDGTSPPSTLDQNAEEFGLTPPEVGSFQGATGSGDSFNSAGGATPDDSMNAQAGVTPHGSILGTDVDRIRRGGSTIISNGVPMQKDGLGGFVPVPQDALDRGAKAADSFERIQGLFDKLGDAGEQNFDETARRINAETAAAAAAPVTGIQAAPLTPTGDVDTVPDDSNPEAPFFQDEGTQTNTQRVIQNDAATKAQAQEQAKLDAGRATVSKFTKSFAEFGSRSMVKAAEEGDPKASRELAWATAVAMAKKRSGDKVRMFSVPPAQSRFPVPGTGPSGVASDPNQTPVPGTTKLADRFRQLETTDFSFAR